MLDHTLLVVTAQRAHSVSVMAIYQEQQWCHSLQQHTNNVPALDELCE